MIKVFRKIRQNFLNKGKLSRYLLYALGEIILVVIGILIALYINNKNEQRKSNLLGLSLLKDLKTEIVLDTIDINWNMEHQLSVLKAENELLVALQSKNYSMDEKFNYLTVFDSDPVGVVHISSMESLKNKGLEIISNKKLRKSIARLYDYYYFNYLKFQNEYKAGDLYSMKLPFFQKYFKIKNEAPIEKKEAYNSNEVFEFQILRRGVDPINFEELRSNEEFKIILSETIFYRTILLSIYRETLSKIRKLIYEINIEIDSN